MGNRCCTPHRLVSFRAEDSIDNQESHGGDGLTMKRLLVVDDDVESLAVARARLADDEIEISCATGGRAGLEAANSQTPDLILLDLDMPDMSGFDVCRILKTDPELCLIPVLFLSGSGTSDDKVRGLDLGAVDYIMKPFDDFELRARVRAAIRTKELQDLLIEHAHIDPLTGIPNRRALTDRLRMEWARIQRHGGELSFIMADIDHFKRVNDTYGHSTGDKALQEVARTIARQCRKSDLAARYGGEEFAIVVPNEGLSGAVHLAERCRQEIEKINLPAKGEPICPTASFGVADAVGLSSAESLVDRADQALYRAKAAGRNRVTPS
jgi:two-component system cell cycle response regulator